MLILFLNSMQDDKILVLFYSVIQPHEKQNETDMCKDFYLMPPNKTKTTRFDKTQLFQ